MPGVWVIGMLSESVASGASLEEAVTLLVRLPPAFISARVTVCCAVQVMVLEPEVGGSEAAGQLTDPSMLSSMREIPVSVMLPVLVTR